MNPKPIIQNALFYGDNLPILREYLSDESVDLIYLDPPFKRLLTTYCSKPKTESRLKP